MRSGYAILIPFYSPSLCHDKIEFSRSLLIEKRAFRLVTAAPMLVAARDSDEISRPDALLTGFILIQICSFDDDQPHIARMRVHSRVVPRLELRECSVRTL